MFSKCVAKVMKKKTGSKRRHAEHVCAFLATLFLCIFFCGSHSKSTKQILGNHILGKKKRKCVSKCCLCWQRRSFACHINWMELLSMYGHMWVYISMSSTGKRQQFNHFKGCFSKLTYTNSCFVCILTYERL